MKKIVRKSALLGLVALSLGFAGCSANILDGVTTQKNAVSQEVVIGDKIIYGDKFSFESVYKDIFKDVERTAGAVRSARSAGEEVDFELAETDVIQMVYFSVQPSTVESIKLVYEKMGYLNPVELDKEIIQSCDPDKLIFKTVEFEDTENIEEYVNFETKYYYIATKEVEKEMSAILEGFEAIEEFEMITEEALERISNEIEEYAEECDKNARGIFSAIWGGIKKAANAVVTATQAVIDFIVKPYEISGTLEYTYNNQTVSAYGINVKNVTIGGSSNQTDINGKFNLGSRTDSAGLCFLWLDYENSACNLSNFLGVSASTLVKTAFPSCLQNVTITTNSDYANAKMAICSDMYARYQDESKRHSNIPQAVVWTTELGNGTSSSPAFHYLGAKSLPDVILTGVTAKAEKNALGKLETLHHEYTHFMHCVYTNNSRNFWDNVILSEIGCTIANATVDVINKIFDTSLETGFIYSYNFENPYVYFTENYAEWYSYVGCYGKGLVGSIIDPTKAAGLKITSDSNIFDNQAIFKSIVKLIGSADNLVEIIDRYDVITYNDLYKALVDDYPWLKTKINEAFKNNYKQKGTRTGNVIEYK